MPERPSGTVTFLFTDVQGSTRLLRELGAQRYGVALEDHRRLLREAFERHGGYEVDTQGDAFFVAFDRALDAVRAAADGQQALAAHLWPDGRTLRVRMGVHTCEATSAPDGYVGMGVHRAARICAAGHGGQVLLSQTARDLLQDEGLDGGAVDLGVHRLKDLTQPQRLFQLFVPNLPTGFPPLRSLENQPVNLPAQPTPLIGRARELDEVCGLMRRDDVHLVTLTGPGGTGKSRLALQAAADLVGEFPHGVFFVPLASLTDPDLVVSTIAQTLGVNEASGQSLVPYMATKKMLLLMDTFEHVAAAGPDLADLLAKAPGVKVLATSREPLRLSGERVYPVAPLELPDPRRLPDPAALRSCAAVAMFVERARAVDPAFELTSENEAAIAEICVRLDGLPLALELAAARVTLLSPQAMVERLGERLKLLTSGTRDLPQRQRTLRDALSWSHDLLDADEQRLFARLGVFAGGFSLEAAEAVVGAALDTLASLVDKSLVRRDGERFAMLDTVREYALEQLVESGDEEATRSCHADFFAELAAQAYEERFEHESEHSEELEREHDNLRAALDWLAAADRGRQLSLAGALGWFWHVHSHFAEGRARLADALAGTAARDPVRARALTAAGELAAWAGDLAFARPLVDEAVSIWRDLGRDQDVAFALHELGWGYFYANDDSAARRCMEESLELQRSIGVPFLVNRAQIGLLQVLVSMGELETVERLALESVTLSQQLGDLRSEHFAVHFLADCSLIRGDCVSAEEKYHRSLELAVELRDRSETAVEIQGLGMAAAGRSRPRRALRLAGAAAAEIDALAIDLSAMRFWTDLLDRYFGLARDELGTDEAKAVWDEGRQLSLEQAIEEALVLDLI